MDRRFPHRQIYDPHASAALVRAHRPPGGGAASDVVSDAVWSEVLGLLRWSSTTLGCSGDLLTGTAWRTAAASAALLRRLPALCDERGEWWRAVTVETVPGIRPGIGCSVPLTGWRTGCGRRPRTSRCACWPPTSTRSVPPLWP